LLPVQGIDWATQTGGVAYNLTVADLHTYFVVVSDAEVLVHNTCGSYTANDWEHYDKHKWEFRDPATGEVPSMQEYMDNANRHYQRADTPGVETRWDVDRVRIYDPKTNTFGSFTPSGGLISFSKPDKGADIWKDT
jgi:pyocin large subunit-like protein